MGKATVEDINAALNAKEVNSKITVDEKGSLHIVKNRIVTPLGKEIFSFPGKKLIRQVSAVIGGKNVVFEKGTSWESIDPKYKLGPSAVNWKPEYFDKEEK